MKKRVNVTMKERVNVIEMKMKKKQKLAYLCVIQKPVQKPAHLYAILLEKIHVHLQLTQQKLKQQGHQ